jgi:hypothetical protein
MSGSGPRGFHPDFGLALCAAYATAGIPGRCQSFELVPKDQDYAGAFPFFLANMNRRSADASEH